MALSVVTFFITLVLNIAIGVAVFFFMLLAMNGFSESDANYGLVTYIILAVLVTLLMSALAVITASRLSKRGFRPFSSALVGIGSFTAVGLVLKVVCSIIGVLFADFVRTNY